jgi:hypothetical protein
LGRTTVKARRWRSDVLLRTGIFPADINRPLHEDRCVQDAITPESLSKSEVTLRQRLNGDVGDAHYDGICKGGQTANAYWPNRRVEIGHVARDMKSGDLSLTILHLAYAGNQA